MHKHEIYIRRGGNSTNFLKRVNLQNLAKTKTDQMGRQVESHQGVFKCLKNLLNDTIIKIKIID